MFQKEFLMLFLFSSCFSFKRLESRALGWVGENTSADMAGEL
jgi:hypothetical protein